jgi:hypothetical protein
VNKVNKGDGSTRFIIVRQPTTVPYQQEHKEEVISAVRKFAQSINYGRKVVPDMSMLIEATSKVPLTNLDSWERLIRWELFRELKTSTPAKWKFWLRPADFLTWIDLCSEDGFKREKTLRTLSGAAPNAFLFSMALRRLNDWVIQVREAACDALPVIAKATNPEIVVDVLCSTLPHWNSWGRMNDQEKQALLEIIAIEQVGCSLRTRILSATSGPMTTILSQAGRTEILDNYLTEIAKKAIQPSVRAKAYQCLLEGKIVWLAGRTWVWIDKQYCKGSFKPILGERNLHFTTSFLDTLKSAATDCSPMVRRIAGDSLISALDKIGVESLEMAQLLASDSSPSVAERGKYALKRLGKPVL